MAPPETALPAGTTSTEPQVAAARGAARFHRLRVAEVAELTPEAVAITFDVPEELRDAFRYTPGQHLTLRTTLDGQEVRRSYSICAAPSEQRLRIAVKRVEGGLFSGHASAGLRRGDVLDVMTPAGRFGVPLHRENRKHYAAVVAGSGITPVLSILGAVLETEPASRFTLVYGNRTSGSVMFLEELADHKDRWTDRLQVLHVLSRERQDADLLHGRIDEDKLATLLDAVVPPDDVDEWLLCGPFGLVQQVQRTLLDRGVPRARIHLELFHVEDDAPAPRTARRSGHGEGGGPGSEVTVRLAGRTTTFAMPPEGSVLDAAVAVRNDAPYACKAGVCGTCRCKVLEGAVELSRSYALEQSELDDGFVLACQSVPTTPRLVLDFDA